MQCRRIYYGTKDFPAVLRYIRKLMIFVQGYIFEMLYSIRKGRVGPHSSVGAKAVLDIFCRGNLMACLLYTSRCV